MSNSRSLRISTDFLPVDGGVMVQLEIYCVCCEGQKIWFKPSHKEEILSRVYSVISDRLEKLEQVSCAAEKTKHKYIGSAKQHLIDRYYSEPQVLSGENLRMAYSFKKNSLIYNSFLTKTDAGYETYRLHREKLVVYAHLPNRHKAEQKVTEVHTNTSSQKSQFFAPVGSLQVMSVSSEKSITTELTKRTLARNSITTTSKDADSDVAPVLSVVVDASTETSRSAQAVHAGLNRFKFKRQSKIQLLHHTLATPGHGTESAAVRTARASIKKATRRKSNLKNVLHFSPERVDAVIPTTSSLAYHWNNSGHDIVEAPASRTSLETCAVAKTTDDSLCAKVKTLDSLINTEEPIQPIASRAYENVAVIESTLTQKRVFTNIDMDDDDASDFKLTKKRTKLSLRTKHTNGIASQSCTDTKMLNDVKYSCSMVAMSHAKLSCGLETGNMKVISEVDSCDDCTSSTVGDNLSQTGTTIDDRSSTTANTVDDSNCSGFPANNMKKVQESVTKNIICDVDKVLTLVPASVNILTNESELQISRSQSTDERNNSGKNPVVDSSSSFTLSARSENEVVEPVSMTMCTQSAATDGDEIIVIPDDDDDEDQNDADNSLSGSVKKMRSIDGLNAEKIQQLVLSHEQFLRDIFQGKTSSRRHADYKAGGAKRRAMSFETFECIYSEDQRMEVMSALKKIFCQRHDKYFDYLLRVLLPEMLLKLYQLVNGIDDADAAENQMNELALSMSTMSQRNDA